jgi:hypothetical protein
LIFVGSTTAFASMVSANIVFMMASYVIPQGIAAYRGRSSVLPARNFDLGKFGLPINAISCIWFGFLAVVACAPTVRPVSLSNMNWVRYEAIEELPTPKIKVNLKSNQCGHSLYRCLHCIGLALLAATDIQGSETMSASRRARSRPGIWSPSRERTKGRLNRKPSCFILNFGRACHIQMIITSTIYLAKLAPVSQRYFHDSRQLSLDYMIILNQNARFM